MRRLQRLSSSILRENQDSSRSVTCVQAVQRMNHNMMTQQMASTQLTIHMLGDRERETSSVTQHDDTGLLSKNFSWKHFITFRYQDTSGAFIILTALEGACGTVLQPRTGNHLESANTDHQCAAAVT